ncbi:MAG: hypothetical protein GFH24_608416n25 [Chloroflexi bacterium AL-N5]|nr:hypothetical protein [Chloroflexi bacterium AL-N5]
MQVVPDRVSGKKTIMVVDDSAVQRRFFEVLLGLDDYDIVCFNHAAAVCNYLSECPVDLVILDANTSQDRFEMCRTIKSKYQLPVMMVGAVTEHQARQNVEICADIFLNKPLMGKGLRQVVKRYIR